jgi:hypothetical protein
MNLLGGQLPEFVPYTETAGGKSPVDIQVWTSDATGTAFEASLVAYNDPIVLEFIYIGWADVQTRLFFAIFHTNLTIDNPKMRCFIHVETIKKKFVFYCSRHQTLLNASQQSCIRS